MKHQFSEMTCDKRAQIRSIRAHINEVVESTSIPSAKSMTKHWMQKHSSLSDSFRCFTVVYWKKKESFDVFSAICAEKSVFLHFSLKNKNKLIIIQIISDSPRRIYMSSSERKIHCFEHSFTAQWIWIETIK